MTASPLLLIILLLFLSFICVRWIYLRSHFSANLSNYIDSLQAVLAAYSENQISAYLYENLANKGVKLLASIGFVVLPYLASAFVLSTRFMSLAASLALSTIPYVFAFINISR
ncbi:putative membrane protein [Synechococcus sp. Minos11]|nr:putative membrane protein [Synechococcus sp. Minos11]